jgi:hypothetical protein
MAKDVYIIAVAGRGSEGYTEIPKALDQAERRAKEQNVDFGIYKLVATVGVKHVTQIHWQAEDRKVDIGEFDIEEVAPYISGRDS